MKIVLTFDSMEELKTFAGNVVGTGETKPETPQASVSQPAAMPVQAQPPVSAPAAPAMATMPPAQPAPPVSTGVPTSAVTYTLDDLARASMVLMDSGRQVELINLLSQFGAASLTELKPNQFGAFATALRGLGAQI